MRCFGRYTLGLAVLVLLLAGCDSGAADEEVAPPLLPADAFALQTSLFNQTAAAKTGAGPHFSAAALRVWPVSVIISANLVVPVAVTAAALQVEPEQDGTTWTWVSTTQADGRAVTFRLEGSLRGGTIRWSMRVSYFDGEHTLDDFELYTATTDLTSQTGTWQLFYLIDGARRNVLNADFAVASETQAAITYSIPGSADLNASDSVRYEVDGDARVFDWRQVAEALDHLVAWDATTHAGSITATNYNAGQEACWDAALDNVECTD